MTTFDTGEDEQLRCASFLRRTPQGEFRYRLHFADGTSKEVDADARAMLPYRVPRCLDEVGKKIAAVKSAHRPSLPEEGREEFPMADGLLDYFPNALAEVARWSKIGNDKHNPGQPIHWNRKKSRDHRNKIARHLIDAGRRDKDGYRHSAALAWRALALLQEELEREEDYPTPRNARD